MRKKKGYYSISAVAQMFSVHQQTIRLYEREGLITPKRSEGNTRLFTEEDIAQLEEVIHLTHKIGVNLAGVELILRQRKKIERMQKEMNTLFKRLQQELETEEHSSREHLSAATQELARAKEHSLAGRQQRRTRQIPVSIAPTTTKDDHE